MRLKFKKHQFQEDAVNYVCDVFQGQCKDTHKYIFGRKKVASWIFGRIEISMHGKKPP